MNIKEFAKRIRMKHYTFCSFSCNFSTQPRDSCTLGIIPMVFDLCNIYSILYAISIYVFTRAYDKYFPHLYTTKNESNFKRQYMLIDTVSKNNVSESRDTHIISPLFFKFRNTKRFKCNHDL